MFIGNKKCRIYAACGVSQTPNYNYKLGGRLHMKYYTVIVVKIDAFESQIINERHFGNYEDAEEFSRNVPQGTACMIAELKSPLI